MGCHDLGDGTPRPVLLALPRLGWRGGLTGGRGRCPRCGSTSRVCKARRVNCCPQRARPPGPCGFFPANKGLLGGPPEGAMIAIVNPQASRCRDGGRGHAPLWEYFSRQRFPRHRNGLGRASMAPVMVPRLHRSSSGEMRSRSTPWESLHAYETEPVTPSLSSQAEHSPGDDTARPTA
jgi:hypothetical protein